MNRRGVHNSSDFGGGGGGGGVGVGSGSGGTGALPATEAASIGRVSAELNRLIADELESFGKKIQSNADGFDVKQVDAWKQNILNIADAQARFQNELEKTKALILMPHEFDALISMSFGDLGTADTKAADKSVSDYIKSKCEKFDCNTSKLKDSLNILFRVNASGNKRAAADDIEVVETEAREDDFKCMMTFQRFENPYMNPGGCKHHVEKTAILALFKGKQTVKCPQMGCSAVWNKDTCRLDEDFLFKMNRFFKKSQTQKSQRNTLSQDDDNSALSDLTMDF